MLKIPKGKGSCKGGKRKVIPSKIKISGIEYEVRCDKDTELICGNADGEARYTNCQIVLKSTLEGDYKNYVFMHELVHCMFNSIGRSDLRCDEQLTDAMAHALYQVLKDNDISFYAG